MVCLFSLTPKNFIFVVGLELDKNDEKYIKCRLETIWVLFVEWNYLVLLGLELG